VALSGSRPVLGLTTYLQQAQTGIWDVRASFLPAIYIDGVNLAGGIAALLPPQPVDAEIASRVLDGLDGLIITGGRDVDPAGYGQQPHPATDEATADNRQRDALEFALVDGAIRRGYAGTRDLPWRAGDQRRAGRHPASASARRDRPHPHQQGNAVFSTSAVRTVPGTRLASLIGESSDAQCYHHQAIDRLGDRLIVSAQDSDGVIEAVEIPGENFVLAVQWHPEERLDDLRLFAGAVQAAATYATEKVSA